MEGAGTGTGTGGGGGAAAFGTGGGRRAAAAGRQVVAASGDSSAGALGYVFLIILGIVHVVAPIVWHLAESDDALELSDAALNERTSEEMLTAAAEEGAAAGEGETLAEAVQQDTEELGFFEKFGFGGRMFQKFSTSMLFILLLTYLASGVAGMVMNGKMQKATGWEKPNSFFNAATAPLGRGMVYWWVIYSAVMVGCFIFSIFIRLLAGASRADAYQYFKGNLWKPDQTELRRTCIDWGCGWIGPGRGYGEGELGADWPVSNIAPTCSGVPLSMDAPILPDGLVDSLQIDGEFYPDHTHVCQRPIARWNDEDEDED